MDGSVKLQLVRLPCQVFLIQPDNAPRIWDQIAPLFEKAIKRGHAERITTTTLLLAGVLTNRCQLWVCGSQWNRVEAAAISRINPWDIPGNQSLHVPIVGAKPHTIKYWGAPLFEALNNYRAVTGCMNITGEFRPGWARAFGFKITGVNLAWEPPP